MKKSLLLFVALVFAFSLQAQTGNEVVNDVFAWLNDNYIFLLTILYELVTRAFPNWQSYSLLRVLMTVIDILIPDRKEGFASHGVLTGSGTNTPRTVFAWIGRIIPALISIAMIITLEATNVFGLNLQVGFRILIYIFILFLTYIVFKPRKEK